MHCRPRAFECFARQVPTIDSSGSEGLLAAAVAISMHELGEVDVDQIDSQLQEFAETVAERVPHLVEKLQRREPVDPEPILAHLHSVLFDEAQFRGNMNDYYNPLNSYIPSVLETRCGIPITLTLIYKNVAERLGLMVHGINAPGHFLAAIDPPASRARPQIAQDPAAASLGLEPPMQAPNCGCARMYIDTFCGGRVLNKTEVFHLLEQTLGRCVSHEGHVLCPASNRQWLNRLLQNLQNIFAFTKRESDLAAMQEMAALLQTP